VQHAGKSSRHKLLAKITHDFSINLFKLPASPHTKLGSGRAGGHGAADAGRNKQVHINAQGALWRRVARKEKDRKKHKVVAEKYRDMSPIVVHRFLLAKFPSRARLPGYFHPKSCKI
jgi:hypothetical protein